MGDKQHKKAFSDVKPFVLFFQTDLNELQYFFFFNFLLFQMDLKAQCETFPRDLLALSRIEITYVRILHMMYVFS